MQPLVQLQNVDKGFPRRRAMTPVLQDVSLELAPGAMVALLGESGSGKTSLARLITGQEQPDRGRILYQGQPLGPLGKRPFAQAAAIHYIFQNPYACMDGRQTVAQVLAEPRNLCRRHGHCTKPAEEVMALVGLSPYDRWAGRRVATLSGGQRQRLAVARALVPDPRLLIADESTSMLDGPTAISLLAMLRELNQSTGLSILLISHQIQLLRPFCDDAYLLHQGAVVEHGSIDEILSSPNSAYGRSLVESLQFFGEEENIV